MLTKDDIIKVLNESLFLHEENEYSLFYTPLTGEYEIIDPYRESVWIEKTTPESIADRFNGYSRSAEEQFPQT
jgi:hypothetical protein